MVFIHERRPEDNKVNQADNENKEPAGENSILSDVNNNITESNSPQSNSSESQQSNDAVNIINNHDFSRGLKEWSVISTGESGYVVPNEAGYLDDVLPYSGINYAIVTRRAKASKGLEQNITGRLKDNVKYRVTAWVRVFNVPLHADGKAKVKAILRLEYLDKHDIYPELVSARASTYEWTKLESTFSLWYFHNYESPKVAEPPEGFVSPRAVVFKLEGPDEGIELLVDSVVISPIGNAWDSL